MTADWSTEAREVGRGAARAKLHGLFSGQLGEQVADEIADAVLTALAPHVQPRADDWEWGVRTRSDMDPVSYGRSKGDAQGYMVAWSGKPGVHDRLVRRHPATEWEDAP